MLATARRTVVAAAAAAFLLSAAPAAAQELPPETVVARVGDVPVDYATVKRWQLSLLRRRSDGDTTYDVCVLRAPRTDAGRRDCERGLANATAMAFTGIVSCHALIQRAVADGITVPSAAELEHTRWSVDRSATGPLDVADAELASRGAWAGDELTRRARAKLPVPTGAQLRQFLKQQDGPPFTTARSRMAAIVALRGRAAWHGALRAVREGRSIAWIGARYGPPAPSRLRGRRLRFAEDDAALRRFPDAVDFVLLWHSTRLGYSSRHRKVVLLIQPYGRVDPGRPKPLEQVRRPLVRLFVAEQWSVVEERFDDDLADFTRARTVCRDSFVTSTLCGSHEDVL